MKTKLVSASIAMAMVIAATATPTRSEEAGTTLDALRDQTHFHGLAVDANDPTRLLLATHHGFFVVTPDGTATRLSPIQDFMGFTPHPSNAGVLYASGHPAGGGNSGFLVSTDGGSTWRQLSLGIGGPVDFHQMDVSAVEPNMIYGSYHGIQVSRDGGANWTLTGAAPAGMIDMAASSKAVDRLFAATKTGLLASDDAGASWYPLSFDSEIVSMVQAGPSGKVYAFVVARGLLVADEADPADWAVLSQDFGTGVILHLAIDPADPQKLYAATQENDLLQSGDGGATWAPFSRE